MARSRTLRWSQRAQKPPSRPRGRPPRHAGKGCLRRSVYERELARSGIVVVTYWFSVSDEQQRLRFESRNAEPLKRWKLSDIELAEHELYVQYSTAKDATFRFTGTKQAPWFVVPSDDKRTAQLNCMSHLLSRFDDADVAPGPVELPEMRPVPYVRPPMREQTFVPQLF